MAAHLSHSGVGGPPSVVCSLLDRAGVSSCCCGTMLGVCLGEVACPSVCATHERCAERGDGRFGEASPPLRRVPELGRVEDDMSVRVGDRVVAAASTTNTPAREGTIEAVIRQQPLRISIRWDDGHTSILTPADGSIRIVSAAPVRRPTKNRRAPAKQQP